jgi:hypothetical protein
LKQQFENYPTKSIGTWTLISYYVASLKHACPLNYGTQKHAFPIGTGGSEKDP